MMFWKELDVVLFSILCKSCIPDFPFFYFALLLVFFSSSLLLLSLLFASCPLSFDIIFHIIDPLSF